MRPALYYKSIDNSTVECILCPHACIIKEGHSGKCGVRIVKEGKLQTLTYDRISALAIDPIEKKPLYHFYPGSSVFSVGSIGCTMQCSYCQNYGISQCRAESEKEYQMMDPLNVLREFNKTGTRNFAFTYNEPVISIENILKIAPSVKENGGNNIMVSNAYVQEGPLADLLPYISAFNIDVKAADENTHKKLTGASLEPVLRRIAQIKHADKHLELTYLVIPGYNDDQEDFSKLCKWISDTLGKDQVLHISRYFPRYKMDAEATPLETMKKLADCANRHLEYVYCGNTGEAFDNNSYCPSCNELLISRLGYRTVIVALDKGKCLSCGKSVPGKFN